MPGFDSFWQTVGTTTDGQVVRCNPGGGGPWQAGTFGAGATDSAILGGALSAAGTHTIDDPTSVILMGNANAISPGAQPVLITVLSMAPIIRHTAITAAFWVAMLIAQQITIL